MPLIKYIQPSFAGGEYSPAIYSRVDIQRYITGLRKCRNFFVHPHGGASNRPGTRYVATTKYATTKESIVQEFIFSRTQRYVLELGDEYIRFYTSGAQINIVSDDVASWSAATAYIVGDYVTHPTASTIYYATAAGTNKEPGVETEYWLEQSIYERPSPYLEDDLADLRFESSADVIFITHPDYQTRTLSRYGETDWRLELYSPQDGPFMPENIDTSKTITASAISGANITLSASAAVFDEDHEGALWRLKHYIEGQTDSTAFGSATTGGSIKCFTTWRLITHGTWTGKLRVEKSVDGGSSWTILRTFTSADDFNPNTFGVEDIELNTEPFLVRINMYDYTSGTCNSDLTTDAFFQDGIVEITTYNSATSVQASVLQEIGDTTAVVSWSEGSWSDFRGWPGVSRFYEDRLCFGGTYAEPMTLWCTQTSNYYSFLRHSILLDTDGITKNIPSRQLNAINGLVALTRLMVLTSASEWSFGPVSGSVLTPTTAAFRVEGYRGSSGINPAVIGNEAIYVQSNNKVMRNIGYEFGSDSFTGAELNILAKHLFDKWKIIDIFYQQDPDSILWCLRDDGNLLGLTYIREQEVVAWHWHDTGLAYLADGSEINQVDYFESGCVVPSDGFDEVWFVANRENGRFIERMALRMEATDCDNAMQYTSDNQLFLDSSISYDTGIDIEDIGIGEDGEMIVSITDHGYNTGDNITVACSRQYNGQYKVAGLGPYGVDNETSLMLHGDGTMGSATIVDDSDYNNTITVNGAASIDTGTKKFGTGSIYFDGEVDSYIVVPNPDPFGTDTRFQGGSHPTVQNTIDFWIKFEAWPNVPGIDNTVAAYSKENSNPDAPISTGYYLLEFLYVNSEDKTYINFATQNRTAGQADGFIKEISIVTNRWYHFAAVATIVGADANKKRVIIFKDGVNIHEAQLDSNAFAVNTTGNPNSTRIGGGFGNGKPLPDTEYLYLKGWMDEIRFSTVPRWLENFTPPTAPYLNSDAGFMLGDPDTGVTLNIASGYETYAGGGLSKEAFQGFIGLDHLEGQTVGILADGVVQDQQTVSSGAITLSSAAGAVHVGLPYVSDLETLNVEIGSKEGTLQGSKVKIGSVTYRFINSRGGYVGPNEDNLYEAFSDSVASYNASTMQFIPDSYDFTAVDRLINYLYTGDLRRPLGAGYEAGGRIFFRQIDPLPVTISAIIPEITAGGPAG